MHIYVPPPDRPEGDREPGHIRPCRGAIYNIETRTLSVCVRQVTKGLAGPYSIQDQCDCIGALVETLSADHGYTPKFVVIEWMQEGEHV